MAKLDRLPKPDANVGRFKAVLRREAPDRLPMAELAIAEEVLAELSGRPLTPLPTQGEDRKGLATWAADRVGLWHQLGYDYYRVRAEIPFEAHLQEATTADGDRRAWVDEHAGVIKSAEDVERYPWPTEKDIDFGQAEAAIACLPDGMEAIGFSGGVLEWTTALVGLEDFMMMLYEQPEVVQTVVDRVGQAIESAFKVFCQMDRVFAIWLGDDMGFKTATLISPEHLREYILPWHRRFAAMAHEADKFFLLHSCGHVESIMPDLLDDVGIDAKHSFEDVIVPVEAFKRRWGDRVAVLGGVDVDLLSRSSPDEVRERTREVIEACGPAGYACGSGNSVTNYVPTENYLAMVETIHRHNGRM